MIYKFKSKASGDLIMLQAHGADLLKIIGKDQSGSLTQGILQPAEMARAIEALHHAVAQEEQVRAEQVGRTREVALAPLPSDAPGFIGLRQRSLPFIQMLQRCHAANEAVVWGI